MKLNIKAVGAAVALALAASAANANGLLNVSNSTGSDLTLNEWTALGNNGETLDLGIQAAALPTSTETWTITNSNFLNIFENTNDDAVWDVVGGAVSGSNSAFATTSTGTTATPVASEPLGTLSVGHAVTNLQLAYGYLATGGTSNTFGSSTTGSVQTSSTNTYWAASNAAGGGNFSDTTETFSDPGNGTASSTMILEGLGTNGQSVKLGTFTLVFNQVFGGTPATSATLTFTPTGATLPLSPVPLPAAVWLFGSGLLGLVGIGRRRLAGGAAAA